MYSSILKLDKYIYKIQKIGISYHEVYGVNVSKRYNHRFQCYIYNTKIRNRALSGKNLK